MKTSAFDIRTNWGIARHGDENERNREQINTKLFHPLLDMPHTNKDTPEVRGDWKNILLLFWYWAKYIV